MKFSKEALQLDVSREAARIEAQLREVVFKDLRRRGAVVGLSGGIDSSVTAALCARALGADRVLGLLMPEGESADDTLDLSRSVAAALGIETVLEDITGLLRAARCYERRDEAIRRVVPEYGPGWRSKIVLPSVTDTDSFRIYSVIVRSPDGDERKVRLTPESYLGIVAATNFKQRTRTMLEYYHADRLNYAVAGTPNRLEYDQGFFVKGGDGLADVKPIAHLYKTQVYGLAAEVGVPEEVRKRPPTTDTYSLPQSQEEFYFSLPYDQMDLCLYGHDHAVPAFEVGRVLGLAPQQIERVYRDIEQKRRSTRYLHLSARLVGDVEERE